MSHLLGNNNNLTAENKQTNKTQLKTQPSILYLLIWLQESHQFYLENFNKALTSRQIIKHSSSPEDMDEHHCLASVFMQL